MSTTTGPEDGAVADQDAARLQAVERGHQRVLADRVVDHRHALAVGDLADPLRDVLARGDDDMGAAVGAGDLGLRVGADGADHGDAERARELAGDQPDAAGGGVVEDRLAALQRMDLPEQVLGGHALHHQRAGGAVLDAVGDRDQHVGRHHAHLGIGALRPEQVADPVAGTDVGDAGPDRLDDADGVGAEAVRQRHRVAAGAEVDVDEVDRDVGVPDPRLSRPGLADLDLLEPEHFRPAELVDANGVGHGVSLPGRRAVRRPPRVPASSSEIRLSAIGHSPKPEAGLRWPTSPRSTSREPQPRARLRDAVEGCRAGRCGWPRRCSGTAAARAAPAASRRPRASAMLG